LSKPQRGGRKYLRRQPVWPSTNSRGGSLALFVFFQNPFAFDKIRAIFREAVLVNSLCSFYRYISANVSETDQVETIFASNVPEMYPVGLCLHILPGAFLHFDAGSWSDL
jgi:hypothetical protein